jgi:putative transposase
LAGSLETIPPLLPRGAPPSFQLKFLRDFLTSEKIWYQVALARQKLEKDPDEIITNLKYHLLWNTRHRRAVFKPPNSFFEGLDDLFLGFGEMVGGMASVMWVAPDHIHVYLETDGRKSIETLQKKMKTVSAEVILETFLEIRQSVKKGTGLWDKAYFVETIG